MITAFRVIKAEGLYKERGIVRVLHALSVNQR